MWKSKTFSNFEWCGGWNNGVVGSWTTWFLDFNKSGAWNKRGGAKFGPFLINVVAEITELWVENSQKINCRDVTSIREGRVDKMLKPTASSVTRSSCFFFNINSDAFWLLRGHAPSPASHYSNDDQTKAPVTFRWYLCEKYYGYQIYLLGRLVAIIISWNKVIIKLLNKEV